MRAPLKINRKSTSSVNTTASGFVHHTAELGSDTDNQLQADKTGYDSTYQMPDVKKADTDNNATGKTIPCFFDKIPVHSAKTLSIQPKLSINEPGDEYEQEADAVADKIMRMTDITTIRKTSDSNMIRRQAEEVPEEADQPEEQENEIEPGATNEVSQDEGMQDKEEGDSIQRMGIQRKCAECDKEEEKGLQRKESGNAAPSVSGNVSQTLQSPGHPLDDDSRSFMEQRFGFDFSRVRIHNDSLAHQSARDINALAYTYRHNIVFGEGQYQPQTESGKRLLGHELAHTVQQGAVARQPSSSTVKGLGRQTMSRLAMTNATDFTRANGFRTVRADASIQRTTSHGVSVSNMRFAPKELPADGKTISRAKVRVNKKSAGIAWNIVGAAFGSVIDAKGVITPGAAITKGKDKVRIKVEAKDTVVPGAHTFGFLTLWDVDYLQAKIDYPKFRALPFRIDPFTPGNFGNLDIQYKPGARRLDATLRVNFTFLDDKAGASKWNKASKHAFEQKFINVVQNRWSNRFLFVNIREPQSIWKKLNPVRVRVRVRKDTKAPHQAIDVHKKVITAAVGVGGVRGKAEFGAGNDRPSAAFNPATAAAELAALAALTPTPILFAAGKFDIPAADKARLEFMAIYLRRIRNPRFNINITGHHQTVVHGPKDTKKQQNTANKAAKKLSQFRAIEIHKVLKTGKATFHHIKSKGIGDKGAGPVPAWDKAHIASTLPAGWKNVQTTLEHEAGHMFGIGDEYTNKAGGPGTPTSHYALTMKAFGKQYSDVQAKKVADSASLMNGGNDIRPHHYVTFWDGLSQMTAAAALPKIPFAHADWKFKGEF